MAWTGSESECEAGRGFKAQSQACPSTDGELRPLEEKPSLEGHCASMRQEQSGQITDSVFAFLFWNSLGDPEQDMPPLQVLDSGPLNAMRAVPASAGWGQDE